MAQGLPQSYACSGGAHPCKRHAAPLRGGVSGVFWQRYPGRLQ